MSDSLWLATFVGGSFDDNSQLVYKMWHIVYLPNDDGSLLEIYRRCVTHVDGHDVWYFALGTMNDFEARAIARGRFYQTL